MYHVYLRWPATYCALAIVMLGNLGCGSGSNLQKVSGKVTVDGTPLAKGSVRFIPDKTRGNTAGVEPVAQIAADGTYTLATNGKSGAPLGWYKVSLDATEVADSARAKQAKLLISPRFHSPETTPLSVEVISSPEAGAYDLKASAR